MNIPTLLLGLLSQSSPLSASPLSVSNAPFIRFTNTSVYPDAPIYFSSTNLLVIEENGTNVVTISTGGKVTLATKPEAAAAQFWRILQQVAHQSSVLQSNREEVLEVLKGCRDYLNPDLSFTQAVYVPPATRLRAEADAIEKREAFVKRLETLLEKLK